MKAARHIVLTALVVAALAVAGCGGEADSGGETTSVGASTATESTTSSDQQAESTTAGSEGSGSSGKQKSSGGSKSGSSSGGSSSGGKSGGSKSSGKAVEIVDFDYKPPDLTVSAGTKVRFKNEDATPHTATASDNPDIFDTGSIAGGKSAAVKLKKPGKYPYFCTIHPFMKASLTVK